MSKEVYDLKLKEFSILFGIKEEEMPLECLEIIEKRDFKYSFFSQKDRDDIILDIMHKIDNKKYTTSGKDKKDRWEKGWKEILENFINSGYDKKYLTPQYNRNGLPIRLFRDYVKSNSENFENNWIELIRLFIFHRYLKDKNNIYEFGCGSCYNLLAFAEHDSSKYYHGSDWVEYPKKIIDKIRDHFKLNIHGGVFNMFEPDYNMHIKEDSVALTVGSLEQMGRDFDKYLNFLLDKPFSRCVHVNSILEKYDTKNNMADYLNYKFEVERNYCNGFFTRLNDLEKEGIIKIITMHRVECGGMFGDGYSITVWEKI